MSAVQTFRARSLFALALLLTAMPAFAHDGHGTHGFFAGVLHPLSGIDHLFAIVAVGWWSANLRTRGWCVVPASFATMMLAGALMAIAQVAQIPAEALIIASLLVSGVLLAARVRVTTVTAAGIAAIFAIGHGAAHGAELQSDAAPTWLIGMMASTLSLHLIGIVAARSTRNRARWATPLAGAFGVGAGVVLAVAMLIG
jgi:urease accessory protein